MRIFYIQLFLIVNKSEILRMANQLELKIKDRCPIETANKRFLYLRGKNNIWKILSLFLILMLNALLPTSILNLN
jgi:hypothetical protein